MKFAAMRKLLAVILLCVAGLVVASPGGPIGGIIVKGGKNPGGQMRALATTDADGAFRIVFAERGEYRLEFDGSGRGDFGAQADAGLQVEYALERPAAAADATRPASGIKPASSVNARLVKARLIVNVPTGGAEMRGVLRFGEDVTTAGRAINENGVSTQPSKPRRPVKK